MTKNTGQTRSDKYKHKENKIRKRFLWLIGLIGCLLVGASGYQFVHSANQKSHLADTQKATDKSQKSKRNHSSASKVPTEVENSDADATSVEATQEGNNTQNADYQRDYAEGKQIADEANQHGYLSGVGAPASNNQDYLAGWRTGMDTIAPAILQKSRDMEEKASTENNQTTGASEKSFHGTAKEYIEYGNNGTIIKDMSPAEQEKVRHYNETGEMPKE